jgi:hypothetical protein
MGKKDKHESDNTTPEATVEAVPTVQAIPAEEPVHAVEVITNPTAEGTVTAPPPAEAIPEGQTLAHLVPTLPHLKRILTRFHMPTMDDVEDALEKLTPEKKRAFQDVLERMNPVKPGVHLARNASLMPLDIKVYQGTGNDEMRPPLCPPGGIYTKDSRILAAPREFAAHTRAPVAMVAAVINIYEGQNFWPPREGSDGTVPTGIHPHDDIPFNMITGKPYCRSLDRIRGETFGDCASCRFKPFREKGVRECAQDVQLFVVLQGFTGLYRMILTGTSVRNAGQSIVNRIRHWPYPWYRLFEFDTVSKTEGHLRWFEMQARPAVSPDFPEGIVPDAHEQFLYSLLSAYIDGKVYFPQLSYIYKQSNKASEAPKEIDPAKGGGVADLDAQIAAAEAANKGGGGPVDYSTRNI